MTIAPICACARVRIRGAAGRAGSGLFAAGLALLLAACQSVGPAGGAAASGGTIERLEIRSRAPAFGGARFGEAGAYELITGVVTGRLDPAHPSNATIVDLGLAPRDADGWVTYQSDVSILRPASAERARRVILYDVVNRGRPLAHQLYFNEGGDARRAGRAAPRAARRRGTRCPCQDPQTSNQTCTLPVPRAFSYADSGSPFARQSAPPIAPTICR